MSYTKRQFVEEAFAELGMASYTFDLSPQQLDACLRRLDTMMATWNARGIRLGYPLPSNPQDSDLDTDTQVPDSANEAIITNLAIRLAPQYGKTVSLDTRTTAKQAYDTLLARAAFPIEQQFPRTLPMGAGQKPWRYDDPFMPAPSDPVLSGQEGPLEF
ncbi:MAG: packaged DNA stabilization gp4 family protein [Acetobacteraceae bacterium]|jgi:hypothetical protein